MNDDPNARPTIGERYGVAIGTGTQRDVVLAAGMQRDVLGGMLLRLAAEYDAVRGELELAGQIAPRQETKRARMLDAVKAMERSVELLLPGPDRESMLAEAAAIAAEAAAMPKRTEAEIKSARAFILMGLKSLYATKQAVGALALTMAEKRGVPRETGFKLAGRVLDVYLDPTCHHCDGTGVIGSLYRGAEKVCEACKGTGHRRDILGDRLAETLLARDLFAELQRRAAQAASGMRQAIASDEAAVVTAEVIAGLSSRLDGLRDAEAMAD